MDSSEKARYIIGNNNFMTVATADASGKPWVSPVGYAYDEAYNFYWVSSREALHSRNINDRPEIAISIFGVMPDHSFDGVYIDATAIELTDEIAIKQGIELFATQRPQPSRFVTQSVSDVTGDAAWRMYQATAREVSKRSDGVLNGQAVTIREITKL